MAHSPIHKLLQDAGLSLDQALLMTGDELVEAIGARATYDLVVALDGHGKAIANYPGRAGRRSQDKALHKRNIEILRLRIVERLTLRDIGQAAGSISAARIPQILHDYFGVNKLPRLASSVTVPVEALAVVREALWLHISLIVEELLEQTIRREPDLDDLWDRLDLARALLRDVDAADDDMQLRLGRRRGLAMIEVLRKQLDTERGMDRPRDANVATIERLLKVIG